MSLTATTRVATTSNIELQETEMVSVTDDSYSINLAYLINEVYRPRIMEAVDFGVLISYMPFMREILPQVYSLRRTAPKEAANIFFEYLKNVEEQGKYQAFLDALRRAKYPLLVAALENKEVVNNDHEYNQLISIFFGDISETIDPEKMSQELQMKEVITAEEGEQIRKTARHCGNRDASLELLLKIPHRAENWYKTFLELLIDNGHHKLVQKLDYIKMHEIMNERNKGLNSVTGVTDENDAGHISFTNSTLPINAAAHLVSQRLPVSAADPSVSQRLSVGTADSSVTQSPTIPREFSERVLSELTELKSLVHTQAQCLQALLGKTEYLIGRVDSLERKLNR